MPVIRTYFATPKVVLISEVHCIRHTGYKKMPEL